jgi:hypothetical protein
MLLIVIPDSTYSVAARKVSLTIVARSKDTSLTIPARKTNNHEYHKERRQSCQSLLKVVTIEQRYGARHFPKLCATVWE